MYGHSIIDAVNHLIENNLNTLDLSNRYLRSSDCDQKGEMFRILKANPAITQLNLSGNPLQSIGGLTLLPHLEGINLNDTDLRSLSGFENLVALKKLDIRDTPLSSVSELESLRHLEELYLANARIKDFAPISDLKQLKICYLVACKLPELNILAGKDHLEVLNINSNNIVSLKPLQQLRSLKRLSFINNSIDSLAGIGDLVELEELLANNNRLQALTELSGMSKIKFLDISNNAISSLSGTENLQDLRVLNAGNNKLKEIGAIGNLLKIESLNISANALKTVTPVRKLTLLRDLDISNNQIESLNGLNKLTGLEILRASNNQLSEVGFIKGCKKLKKFEAANNNIWSLKDLHLQHGLNAIDLRRNRISNNSLLALSTNRHFRLSIIVGAGTLPKASYIALAENAISYIPEAIIIQGNEGILSYLAAQEQAAIINTEAKCILFGNGNVGKTTLSGFFRTGIFTVQDQRTHGILIDEWLIQEKDFPAELASKIDVAATRHHGNSSKGIKIPHAMTVRLWDFGGQEYYHATHRLFMSNDVVFLLLWERDTNRQDDSKEEYPYQYWERNINHFAAHSVIINVQNKAGQFCQETDDESRFKINFRNENDQKSIELFQGDTDKLKKGLLRQIAKLPYIGTAFPKVYEDIKIALRHNPKPYITYGTYEKLCLESDLTSEGVMSDPQQRETLVRFLDTTGSVVCFRFRHQTFSEALRNYVFTDPRWLTSLIYEVLERGRPEFDDHHVETIAARYALPADVLIAIMKQFELIFEIVRDDKAFFVAPQYLPDEPGRNEDELLKWALKGKNMKDSFTLLYRDFLPKSNFLRFISKFGDSSVRYLYWKNGLVFIIGKTVFAQCINIGSSQAIRFYIQDNDPPTAKMLFDIFLAIDESADLLYSEDNEQYVPAAKLQQKIKEFKKEIDTTEGVTLNVADFNIAFDPARPKYSSKRSVRLFVSYSNQDRDLKNLLEAGITDHLSNKAGVEYAVWSDTAIDLGADWRAAIDEALESSDGAILLISAGFANSAFIRQFELAEFLNRKKREGYMIFPVLVRRYDFHEFESLSSLSFFKTYGDEYGLKHFRQKDEFMPFDVLAEGEGYSPKNLNDYYYNLAAHIHTAVKNWLNAMQ